MTIPTSLSDDIHKLISDIIRTRDQLKAELCKAYLAEMLDKKPYNDIVSKIELVEQESWDKLSGVREIRWFFRELL